MEPIWTPFLLAAIIGGLASALVQAGSERPSRFVDLIAALVTGCFFGTFALFSGGRALIVEALFCLAWVVWAQVRRRRSRPLL